MNLAAGQEPSSFQLLLLRFKARNPCHILFYGLHGKKFATISCCRQETAATSAHALEGKNLLRSSTACQRLFATWSSQFFLPPTQPLVQENAADAFSSLPGKNLLRGKSQRLKTCQHFFLQCVHFFDGGPYFWEVNHIHLYHRYVVFVVHNSRANERQTDIYSLNHHDCLQPLTEQINYWGPNVYQPAIQL